MIQPSPSGQGAHTPECVAARGAENSYPLMSRLLGDASREAVLACPHRHHDVTRLLTTAFRPPGARRSGNS
jgi:hypothetical protein